MVSYLNLDFWEITEMSFWLVQRPVLGQGTNLFCIVVTEFTASLLTQCIHLLFPDGVFSPLNENNSSNMNMSRRTTLGNSIMLNSGSSPPHLELENGHDDLPIIDADSDRVRDQDITPAPPAPTPTLVMAPVSVACVLLLLYFQCLTQRVQLSVTIFGTK
jgi:hypothetical protein